MVDYDTSFTSVGINQVNFELWLDISTTVRVAVPLQHADITLNRRFAMVNTVIKGAVPNFYGGFSFGVPQ